MATNTSFLLLITLWASVHDGLCLPVVKQREVESGRSGISTERGRSKRCACSTLLDSECHYFCHLDIIWVNTPSKTTVYGLGGALSRRRRSTSARCTCANPDDQICTSFCQQRPAISSPEKPSKKLRILSILRAAAKISRRALDAGVSDSAQRLNTR